MSFGTLNQWLWDSAMEIPRLIGAHSAQQALAVGDTVHKVIPAAIDVVEGDYRT